MKNTYLEENFIGKILLYIFGLSFNFFLKESKTPVSKRKKPASFTKAASNSLFGVNYCKDHSSLATKYPLGP